MDRNNFHLFDYFKKNLTQQKKCICGFGKQKKNFKKVPFFRDRMANSILIINTKIIETT